MQRQVGSFTLARIIQDALNEQFDSRKADPVVGSIDQALDHVEFTVNLTPDTKFRIRIDPL